MCIRDSLKAFFVQNGDNYFYSWFWVNSIDVMVLFTQHLMRKRHEMTDFKQETVARAMFSTFVYTIRASRA